MVSSVSLVSIEQLNYDEYVASLNNPTVIAVVSIDPLPGTVLLEMASSAAMTAIDHMLGGPGGAQPERPLTEVEMPLLRGLLERMLGELRYGFETAGRHLRRSSRRSSTTPSSCARTSPATPWWSPRSR